MKKKKLDFFKKIRELSEEEYQKAPDIIKRMSPSILDKKINEKIPKPDIYQAAIDYPEYFLDNVIEFSKARKKIPDEIHDKHSEEFFAAHNKHYFSVIKQNPRQAQKEGKLEEWIKKSEEASKSFNFSIKKLDEKYYKGTDYLNILNSLRG